MDWWNLLTTILGASIGGFFAYLIAKRGFSQNKHGECVWAAQILTHCANKLKTEFEQLSSKLDEYLKVCDENDIKESYVSVKKEYASIYNGTVKLYTSRFRCHRDKLDSAYQKNVFRGRRYSPAKEYVDVLNELNSNCLFIQDAMQTINTHHNQKIDEVGKGQTPITEADFKQENLAQIHLVSDKMKKALGNCKYLHEHIIK